MRRPSWRRRGSILSPAGPIPLRAPEAALPRTQDIAERHAATAITGSGSCCSRIAHDERSKRLAAPDADSGNKLASRSASELVPDGVRCPLLPVRFFKRNGGLRDVPDVLFHASDGLHASQDQLRPRTAPGSALDIPGRRSGSERTHRKGRPQHLPSGSRQLQRGRRPSQSFQLGAQPHANSA